MKITPISKAYRQLNQTIRVGGWVASLRNQKKMQFIVLRDHTGMVQVVHEKENDQQLAKQISGLGAESVISITGKMIENNQVKLGGVELVVEAIEIISPVNSEIPIASDSSMEARLDWRFIDLRRPENRLIFEIQTAVEHAMRSFWVQNGFLEIHSPKLMGSPSESGAELFSLDYFGKKAYLAQSPQFYKQMAMAAGFNRVFEIGPVFRANPSHTSRHDTEFTSVDMETSWIDSHLDVMDFEEKWLVHILTEIKKQFGEAIEKTFGVHVEVPLTPFPRVTMAEALTFVKGSGHHIPDDNPDLDPEGERILARRIKEEHDHEFVFVTDYPIEVRPFYHMRQANEPHLTKSFDLLWKGLEITTGAQREHRLDILSQQAIEKGLTLEGIKFYLDFFRYGCPPHGGFGFGLTRMLMVLLEQKNVREVTYLYRGTNRLFP